MSAYVICAVQVREGYDNEPEPDCHAVGHHHAPRPCVRPSRRLACRLPVLSPPLSRVPCQTCATSDNPMPRRSTRVLFLQVQLVPGPLQGVHLRDNCLPRPLAGRPRCCSSVCCPLNLTSLCVRRRTSASARREFQRSHLHRLCTHPREDIPCPACL